MPKIPRSIVRTETGRLSRTFLLHLLGALAQATTLFVGLAGILPPSAGVAVAAALYVVQTTAAFILRRFTAEPMAPKPPTGPRKPRARKIVAAGIVLCSVGALVGCGALLSSLGATLDESARKLDFDCRGDAVVELADRGVTIRCNVPGSKVPTIVIGAERVVGP